MTKTKYRSANIIIQAILENILHSRSQSYFSDGIVKTQLIKLCGLKTATADKYFTKMENANYIESRKDHWGEREVIIYQITRKGTERYQWFVKINAELENNDE